MRLSYAELATLLSCFGTDENLTQTFMSPETKEETVIYQQASPWGTLPYLKYVYFARNNIECIVEPLEVDFSEVDFNNLDKAFNGNLNIVKYYSKLCSVVPADTVFMPTTTNAGVIEAVNTINTLYKERGVIGDNTYMFEAPVSDIPENERTVDKLFSTITQRAEYICSALNARGVYKITGQPLECSDFQAVFITDYIPAEVASTLRDRLREECGYELKYWCAELINLIEEKNRARRLEETKAIADKCYGVYFDDNVLRPYKDFANDYSLYDEVYNVVCDWLRNQDLRDRCRFIVGEETCQIPCIEILLAWVTLTTGTVFIFKAELERKYNSVINSVLRGNILPANLKFKMLTRQPLITNRFLLGVSNIKYGHENIDTLVALKHVDNPTGAFRGIPLDLILSEIKCTHDPEERVNVTNTLHRGFYMGRPKFNDITTVVEDKNLSLCGVPYDTIDTVIRNFELRRQEVYDSLGEATDEIKRYYSPLNYERLLSQFLYSFEMIFAHYMGYDKFYTLSDIYIFDVNTPQGVVKYACTLVLRPIYTVNVINFCGNTPVIDTEDMVVDNISSPLFVADFQSAVKEDGYVYPEVNPEIQAAFEKALEVVRPVNTVEDALLIETTVTEEATANIYDYLYPIISTQSTSLLSPVLEIDTEIDESLSYFLKELLYSERRHNINSNVRVRTNMMNSTALSVIEDGTANMKYLYELIVQGLCDRTALYKRTHVLPNLFGQGVLSYRGLRYLHPQESPVDWTGNIRDIQVINPAMCKRR